MVLGTDGNFYRVTEYGGNAQSCKSCGGTVFRITSAGALTTIYNFCSQQYCTDGDNPVGSLVEGIDGNFYGATVLGGNGGGSIFKIDSSGKLTSIYGFCGQAHCADGMFPVGGLVQGTDGNLYGVTRAGGAGSDFHCDYEYGCGTVFKVTPRGTLTTLHSFCRHSGCPDGTAPASGLLQGMDGRFYGTTTQSGINGFGPGTIFRVTSVGRFTTVYRFCSQLNCADGEGPHDRLVQATDGNFYGTTSSGGDINGNPLGDGGGCGTVFEVNSVSATLITLHDFEYTDGYDPFAGLLQGTDGNIYGTTLGGGTPVCSAGPSGCGTMFGLNMGFGPFVAFVQAAGKVGQTGGILGQGLTGTTAVAINGVPAIFTVVSDTYLTATVPQGATTGYVTVTTPSNVLKSNVPFHVIP